MLCSIETLEACAIVATDGSIGHVRDFFFDDRSWVVRYLVVDTGHWLPGRTVLVSPRAIESFDAVERELHVSITKDQVRSSPNVDTQKPVSRQDELAFNDHYGYPAYWGGIGYWGGDNYPNTILPGYGGFGSPDAIREAGEYAVGRKSHAETRGGDRHLRSCREVIEYRVHADDGAIGHVDGMLLDDQTWAIRYLIVDTSNWWFGHRVLVAPSWVRSVNWADSALAVHISRDAIRHAPPYDAAMTFSRAQEADIYRHYEQPAYWTEHHDHELHPTS